jgi:hypothetical protein
MKALPPRLCGNRGTAFPDAFAKTSTQTNKEPYAARPSCPDGTAMIGNVANTLSLPVVRLYSLRRAFVHSAADLPLNDYKQYMSMGSQHRQA